MQLTKLVSTGVAIIDFTDLLDHSVESIGDVGAAHKVCTSTCAAMIDFRDSLDHGVESIVDEGADHKAYEYSCCNYRF